MTPTETKIANTLRAISLMATVTAASRQADGVHVRLNSPVGFNTLNHFVALSEPVKEFGEWVARGELAGVPVRVSLAGGAA